ncbi:MAG: pseudouridine-5'-phosphate glycosidase [Bacteroidetes bacterium]|nr:pseudouridine-5'-phosphate glycosidase [Bacteroidota bacterium]
MHPLLDISPDLQDAVAAGHPIVALESTIIAHGMPWPRNVETALAVEKTVREHGALPATIALLDGKCRVGLSSREIERLASTPDVWKASVRDIPYVIARGIPGATTVAATLRIAAMAGIRVFVTGGIGGVHRGAQQTMDISADLTELSKSSATVVSAGVKSILDIGLTLEALETLGVPVVTLGQNDFPSFYSTHSGHTSPLRVDSLEEIARLMHTKWSLGIEGAILLANPLPPEQGVPVEKIESLLTEALREADKQQIKGKKLTPFLLKSIAQGSNGESLDTNIALVLHNATTGAQLAGQYAVLAKNLPPHQR